MCEQGCQVSRLRWVCTRWASAAQYGEPRTGHRRGRLSEHGPWSRRKADSSRTLSYPFPYCAPDLQPELTPFTIQPKKLGPERGSDSPKVTEASPSRPGCCGTGHTRPEGCSASPPPPSAWQPGPEGGGQDRGLLSQNPMASSRHPPSRRQGRARVTVAVLTEGSVCAGGCFSSSGPFSLSSCSQSA